MAEARANAPFPAHRTVFLVGASSGIGRELAGHLVRDGHRVALCARRADRLEALRAELAGAGAAVTARPADVTDPAALERALAAAEGDLGPFDTLIYSAGAARFASVEATTDAVWREMMSANLDGLFHAVRAILPRFRERRRGHIVAVLSMASRHAYGGSSAYTAAKYGALGFIESLRAEVRKAGLHVTAVLPGATDTPIWDAIGPDWNREKMMRPEQVARVIASILRDTTSGMVEEVRVMPAGGAL